MQYTTSALLVSTFRVLPARMHWLALLCFLALAMLGCPLEAGAGWIVWPPTVYVVSSLGSRRASPQRHTFSCPCNPSPWGLAAWRHVQRTWHIPLWRSMALATLWFASSRVGPVWIVSLPWAIWLWQGMGLLWPGLGHQPEWQLVQRVARLSERVLLWAYLALVLGQGVARLGQLSLDPLAERLLLTRIPLLCMGPSVVVRRDEAQGGYVADLQGVFTLRVDDDHPLRLRLLILFLRLLEDPTEQRGSRRTRDGRTPFVRQEYLARVLGIPQPDLSRWERYWLMADWRRLLSQHSGEVLTLELQQRIIETWAHCPSWGIERIHRFLVAQGVAVTESQVRQVAHESGWQIVRQVPARLCVQRAEELRLREGWLLSDLLGQIELLMGKLEAGEGLTPEEQFTTGHFQSGQAFAGPQG
jgi:hypothetical protein